MESSSFFKHCEKQLKPAKIKSAHRSLRHAINGLSDQCLNFNKQWAHAFNACRDGDSTQLFLSLRNENITWITYGFHSLFSHLINTQFRCISKSVLKCS